MAVNLEVVNFTGFETGTQLTVRVDVVIWGPEPELDAVETVAFGLHCGTGPAAAVADTDPRLSRESPTEIRVYADVAAGAPDGPCGCGGVLGLHIRATDAAGHTLVSDSSNRYLSCADQPDIPGDGDQEDGPGGQEGGNGKEDDTGKDCGFLGLGCGFSWCFWLGMLLSMAISALVFGAFHCYGADAAEQLGTVLVNILTGLGTGALAGIAWLAHKYWKRCGSCSLGTWLLVGTIAGVIGVLIAWYYGYAPTCIAAGVAVVVVYVGSAIALLTEC